MAAMFVVDVVNGVGMGMGVLMPVIMIMIVVDVGMMNVSVRCVIMGRMVMGRGN